jgi:hypothetical protein
MTSSQDMLDTWLTDCWIPCQVRAWIWTILRDKLHDSRNARLAVACTVQCIITLVTLPSLMLCVWQTYETRFNVHSICSWVCRTVYYRELSLWKPIQGRNRVKSAIRSLEYGLPALHFFRKSSMSESWRSFPAPTLTCACIYTYMRKCEAVKLTVALSSVYSWTACSNIIEIISKQTARHWPICKKMTQL